MEYQSNAIPIICEEIVESKTDRRLPLWLIYLLCNMGGIKRLFGFVIYVSLFSFRTQCNFRYSSSGLDISESYQKPVPVQVRFSSQGLVLNTNLQPDIAAAADRRRVDQSRSMIFAKLHNRKQSPYFAFGFLQLTLRRQKRDLCKLFNRLINTTLSNLFPPAAFTLLYENMFSNL